MFVSVYMIGGQMNSDKNIKITRTGGNIIIDNLTDKEINIKSTFVINNRF